jgi:hypothetical protein
MTRLGDWIEATREEFQRRGDEEAVRMTCLYAEGYAYRESDPARALALFTEGRAIAARLGDAWWTLFYDERRAVALLHFKQDYRDVLELAVGCALQLRKPQFAHYPSRFGVHDNLIAAYLGIDPVGYAAPIREALDALRPEVPPGPGGERYLFLARERRFAGECDRLEEVQGFALEMLALADADPDRHRAAHFGESAYLELCRVACRRGDCEGLAANAQAAEEMARRSGNECELAEALAWRALAARQAGDEGRARRFSRAAEARMARLRMPPTRGYFDALGEFYERGGAAAQALQLRDSELAAVGGKGRFADECRAHYERCRLLALVGRLTDADLGAARAAADKLRTPAAYREKLDRLGAR